MSEINDMLAACETKSDQLNADDLIGGDLTICITHVVVNPSGEQRVNIFYEGSDRAYRPCKSMCKLISGLWGGSSKDYVGRYLTLHVDSTVTWGGVAVGGIRIKAASDIKTAYSVQLNATKKTKKLYTVQPLIIAKTASIAPKALLDKVASMALEHVTDADRFMAHLSKLAGVKISSLDTLTEPQAIQAIAAIEKVAAQKLAKVEVQS